MPTAVLINGGDEALTRRASSEREWAGAAIWSLLAAVAARGANLAAIVICARILPQTEFGQVAAVLSTAGVFAPIAGLGLAMTATKFLAEFRDTAPARAGRVLTLALGAALVTGLAMTAVFRWTVPWLAASGWGAAEVEGPLLAASPMIVLGVLESVAMGALAGLGAFARLAVAGAWSGAASIPLVAWMAREGGAAGAVTALTLAAAISCLVHGYYLRAECRRQGIGLAGRGALAEAKLLARFSLPAYLSGLAMAPVVWLGNSILVHTPAGFADLALFSAADRYRSLLVFVPLAVSRTAIPALTRLRARGDASGFAHALRWNLLVALAAVSVPALLCAVLAPAAMNAFGDSFRRGWPVLAVLALSAVPTVMNTQLGAALLADGRAWARAAADVVLAVAFVLMALWVVPGGGAVALAAVYGVAYTIACIMLAILVWRRPDAE